MVRVTASDEMIEELGQLNDLVELYDRRGNRIGTIVPSKATADDYALAQALFTDEEIAAARAEEGEFTTQEVLDELKP